MLWLTLLLLRPIPDTLLPPVDSISTDIVYYGGYRVIFLAQENRVILLDSAWVRYHDMTVYSDSIDYNIKTNTLSAYNSAKFTTPTEEVIGNELHYNVNSRRGMMRKARTKVENGFLSATEIWLVKERVINARSAEFTTCDHHPPHYIFFGPRVKLLMDDMAITQPVVLRIGKVPILAAPFWLVPVASKRKSGLMPFKVGNSKDQGYYAKGISYYWVINDYADATFLADIMTRKGIQIRSEGVWIVEPIVRGSVQGAYIKEIWDSSNLGRPRYNFNIASSGYMPPTTNFDIQMELISDTAYAPDYAEDRLDWLKQEIFSYAALRQRFHRIGRLTLRGERKIYYMRHYQYSNLPALSFNFTPQNLPGNWILSPNISFARRVEQWDSAGIDTIHSRRITPGLSLNLTSPDYPWGRLDITDQLNLAEIRRHYRGNQNTVLAGSHLITVSTSQKVLGIFNTSEGLNINHVVKTDTLLNIEPSYSIYLTTSLSLFRVFGLPNSYIHGILHTLTPILQLNYQPQVVPDGLFGKLNLKPKQALVFLGINNSLQAKIGKTKRKVDLGTVNLLTSLEAIKLQPTPINITINLKPLTLIPENDSAPTRNAFNLWIEGSLSFHPESLKFREDYYFLTSFSWNSKRTPEDTAAIQHEMGWEVRLNHSFGKKQHMLTGAVSFSFGGWRLGINSLGYNFIQRQLTDYAINLWRDLHCWEATFNISGLGKTWRYDFEARIKKLPDVRFGKSTFRTFLP